ncbi:MAG: hypothetical protein ABJE47_04290 [bacterium]
MRKHIAVILATFAIVACDSVTAPDLTTFAGNYALRSVNDTVLPYTVIQQSAYSLAITADTIFMSVNGIFVDVTHYKQNTNDVIDFPADSLGGEWTVDGTTVTFHATSGQIFSGDIGSSTITIIGAGAKAIYSR